MNEENKDISYNESAAGAQEESTRAPEIQPEAQPEQSPDTGAEPAANPFGEGKCADFLESLCSGKASVLFTPVSSVSISDTRLRDAFGSFIDNVGVGNAFRPIDIITAAESVLKRKGLYE